MRRAPVAAARASEATTAAARTGGGVRSAGASVQAEAEASPDTKEQFAAQDWYDVWYPNLAPSPETVKQAQAAATPQEWAAFARKYRAEMATPENRHTLALLARMSQDTNFSVGCYCANEAHCHRSVLRELLAEAGARITP